MQGSFVSAEEGASRKTTFPLARVAWLCWAVLLVAICVRVGLRPRSHSVFTVYWLAGTRWLLGEFLYPTGNQFLYSPVAAAFFVPFSLLPIALSGILWRVLITGFFVLAVRGAFETFGLPINKHPASLGLIALLPLAVGDISNGQAGVLVIALLLLAVVASMREHWHLVAITVAFAATFKVYPLALGLLFCVFYPRQLLWRLVLWTALLFAVSFVLQRLNYVLAQYQNWLAQLGSDDRRLLGPYGSWRDAWYLLRVAGVPIRSWQWPFLQLLAAAAAASFCVYGSYSGWQKNRRIVAAFSLATSWMILFGPATEAATYILLAPAVILTLLLCWNASLWLRSTLGVTYILLTATNAFSAWAGLPRDYVPVRILQPIAACLFLVATINWLSLDKYWSSSRQSQGSQI